MTEGPSNRLLDDHFTKLTHDKERDHPADGITQNHRRPSAAQHASRAKEEPRSDSSAERDQLDMPVFQAALKRPSVQRIAGHGVTLFGL